MYNITTNMIFFFLECLLLPSAFFFSTNSLTKTWFLLFSCIFSVSSFVLQVASFRASLYLLLAFLHDKIMLFVTGTCSTAPYICTASYTVLTDTKELSFILSIRHSLLTEKPRSTWAFPWERTKTFFTTTSRELTVSPFFSSNPVQKWSSLHPLFLPSSVFSVLLKFDKSSEALELTVLNSLRAFSAVWEEIKWLFVKRIANFSIRPTYCTFLSFGTIAA